MTKKYSAIEKKGPALEEVLASAIETTGVAEVIRSSTSGNAIKVLYRVGEKRTWLGILEYVLSRASRWSAHACQQYFMRGGKLVYGWNFILQGEVAEDGVDLERVTKTVAQLFTEASRVIPKVITRGPIDTFPLVGAGKHRNAKNVFDPRLPGPDRGGPSHRGAYSVKDGR